MRDMSVPMLLMSQKLWRMKMVDLYGLVYGVSTTVAMQEALLINVVLRLADNASPVISCKLRWTMPRF